MEAVLKNSTTSELNYKVVSIIGSVIVHLVIAYALLSANSLNVPDFEQESFLPIDVHIASIRKDPPDRAIKITSNVAVDRNPAVVDKVNSSIGIENTPIESEIDFRDSDNISKDISNVNSSIVTSVTSKVSIESNALVKKSDNVSKTITDFSENQFILNEGTNNFCFKLKEGDCIKRDVMFLSGFETYSQFGVIGSRTESKLKRTKFNGLTDEEILDLMKIPLKPSQGSTKMGNK